MAALIKKQGTTYANIDLGNDMFLCSNDEPKQISPKFENKEEKIVLNDISKEISQVKTKIDLEIFRENNIELLADTIDKIRKKEENNLNKLQNLVSFCLLNNNPKITKFQNVLENNINFNISSKKDFASFSIENKNNFDILQKKNPSIYFQCNQTIRIDYITKKSRISFKVDNPIDLEIKREKKKSIELKNNFFKHEFIGQQNNSSFVRNSIIEYNLNSLEINSKSSIKEAFLLLLDNCINIDIENSRQSSFNNHFVITPSTLGIINNRTKAKFQINKTEFSYAIGNKYKILLFSKENKIEKKWISN